MTMLTRCGACGPSFRVTADQLVSRQGKVRCGSCGEVFSALANLTHSPPPGSDAQQLDAPLQPSPGEPPLQPSPGEPPALADSQAPLNAPVSDLLRSTPTTTAHLIGPESTTAAVVLGAATFAHQVEPPSGETAGRQPEQEPGVEYVTEAEATPSVPPGMPQPKRHIPWGSALGVLVTLLLLLVQGAYFYRNEITAHYPESKPALTALCVQLACSFDTPRDAQAISIESHDLQAEPTNKSVLALVALLRNRAGYAQDAPHLELTLTDAQDAPLARRVLSPRDYLAPSQIAAGSELPVRVMLDTSQVRASGYRLYAFYP